MNMLLPRIRETRGMSSYDLLHTEHCISLMGQESEKVTLWIMLLLHIYEKTRIHRDNTKVILKCRAIYQEKWGSACFHSCLLAPNRLPSNLQWLWYTFKHNSRSFDWHLTVPKIQPCSHIRKEKKIILKIYRKLLLLTLRRMFDLLLPNL